MAICGCIPVNILYTKYIYHELPKAVDMLPFKAMGVTNELKTGYLTSGQAQKEVYEAITVLLNTVLFYKERK